ncbi:10195_t:CDS:2 [Funneliformis caledonium]|uniref:10195_t:CDS:1 n=1 Tax=Funneliformis caledonium TaxID=1117310 RepID=A0A9N9D4E7_9GLOM|nr:10195_t:CDS:2 [Funneliformis caledonium]
MKILENYIIGRSASPLEDLATFIEAVFDDCLFTKLACFSSEGAINDGSYSLLKNALGCFPLEEEAIFVEAALDDCLFTKLAFLSIKEGAD